MTFILSLAFGAFGKGCHIAAIGSTRDIIGEKLNATFDQDQTQRALSHSSRNGKVAPRIARQVGLRLDAAITCIDKYISIKH